MLYKQIFLDNYFPKELKQAEIIPVYKKGDPLKKENYSTDLLAYCLNCQRFSKHLYVR